MERIDPKEITDKFKEELLSLKIPPRLRPAFLAGAIRGAGELRISERGVACALVHGSEGVIEKCFALTETLGCKGELRTRLTGENVRRERLYELVFEGEGAGKLLKESGVLTPSGAPSLRLEEDFYTDPAKKRAFLRALAMTSGSLALPRKSEAGEERKGGYMGYMAELKLGEEEIAKEVRALLASYALPVKFRLNREQYVIYVQGGEATSDFLAALGLNETLFALRNFMAERSLSNTANRLANCDAANCDKTMLSASRQLSAIEALANAGKLETLDARLTQAAVLRREHPTASLEELSALSAPHIGKSGLNHRLERLIELARALRDAD